jgi:hypothetical protein
MTNNDILKKLRVALMLRDDEIVDILELVDFRISKSEIGAFCRKEGHPKYQPCGDQVLRNFLNGLVIYLRGTREQPKDPKEYLAGKQQFMKSPQHEKKKPAPGAVHPKVKKSPGKGNFSGNKKS